MKLSTTLTATALLLAGAALAHPAQAAGVIGASLLTQQHPFYIELGRAMQEEATKDGVTLQVSIANQDLNKQIADVEDFITKKVDVIIISPVDSSGVRGAVRKAQKAGIKVITVDVPAKHADVAAYVGTDNYAGGEKAGELMASQLGDTGQVGIIDYPTVQSVVDRVNGFRHALEAHPNVKIVADQAGITRAEALSVAQNMLQANPGITGIFGFGDDAALAAVSAVHSAKRAGTVKVIGFDGMQEARTAVDHDPVFVGVIRQYPDRMGAQAIDSAVALIAGKTVEPKQLIVPGVYTKADAAK
ncbi:substrate-binding domain-containing protein [Lichenicola cladoniae]|uniref:Substrate-binding domain-containing protein n=1 Tax=Lichenicola cladoniae TaxID=1484109 RepID=A0A6M8HR47_9PROT|nr:substrate-binding domain-containing protein [Lichenicola cladoniae]NPD69144.1 substrate-binding domain-containing protein [Acetobacteraceae bacterium]QKE90963.1 substrate-binding domain-containing protein [Lichenicola cladoniae]